jgi:hypothetical protein
MGKQPHHGARVAARITAALARPTPALARSHRPCCRPKLARQHIPSVGFDLQVRRDVALPAAGERRLEGRLGGLKAFRAIEKKRDVIMDAPLAAGLPAEQRIERRLEVDVTGQEAVSALDHLVQVDLILEHLQRPGGLFALSRRSGSMDLGDAQ